MHRDIMAAVMEQDFILVPGLAAITVPGVITAIHVTTIIPTGVPDGVADNLTLNPLARHYETVTNSRNLRIIRF